MMNRMLLTRSQAQVAYTCRTTFRFGGRSVLTERTTSVDFDFAKQVLFKKQSRFLIRQSGVRKIRKAIHFVSKC